MLTCKASKGVGVSAASAELVITHQKRSHARPTINEHGCERVKYEEHDVEPIEGALDGRVHRWQTWIYRRHRGGVGSDASDQFTASLQGRPARATRAGDESHNQSRFRRQRWLTSRFWHLVFSYVLRSLAALMPSPFIPSWPVGSFNSMPNPPACGAGTGIEPLDAPLLCFEPPAEPACPIA